MKGTRASAQSASFQGGPGPLRGGAVWTSVELRARPEWNHRLDTGEQAELRSLAELVEGDDAAPVIGGRGLDELSGRDLPLPILARRLAGIREQLECGTGAVRLRGFPIDGLSENQARVLYWALSVHLGTPVSQSASGLRMFSVRDARFGRADPRARGPNTSKPLSFHTDRSDVVGFLCLGQAREGGENEIVSSMTLYNEILASRPELCDTLREPFYYLRHTVDTANDRPWCRQPVFSFCDGFFACCLLRVLIERAHEHPDLPDLTPRQVEALDMVESIAASAVRRVRFRQEPGDIIWLNNWVVLHKRQAFRDWPQPARRRHILRVWLSMPNSRQIDPVFLDNYGAVDAGAIRGGMRGAS